METNLKSVSKLPLIRSIGREGRVKGESHVSGGANTGAVTHRVGIRRYAPFDDHSGCMGALFHCVGYLAIVGRSFSVAHLCEYMAGRVR